MGLIKRRKEVELLFPKLTYEEFWEIIDGLEEECYRKRDWVLYERLVSNNPYNDAQTLHILNTLGRIIQGKFYRDNDACQTVFELIEELEKKLNGSDEQPLITTHKPIENFTYFTPIKKENPPAPQLKGFDLGKDEAYLKKLYQALVDAQFLAPATKVEHFINAFNGQPLVNFEPLAWVKNQTNLSLFVANLTDDHKWKKAEIVFKDMTRDNLKKSYGAASKLDKHKKTNLQFGQILDGR